MELLDPIGDGPHAGYAKTPAGTLYLDLLHRRHKQPFSLALPEALRAGKPILEERREELRRLE